MSTGIAWWTCPSRGPWLAGGLCCPPGLCLLWAHEPLPVSPTGLSISPNRVLVLRSDRNGYRENPQFTPHVFLPVPSSVPRQSNGRIFAFLTSLIIPVQWTLIKTSIFFPDSCFLNLCFLSLAPCSWSSFLSPRLHRNLQYDLLIIHLGNHTLPINLRRFQRDQANIG